MMKTFLIWVMIASIPIICGAIAIEYILRQIENDYSYKNEWLTNNASRVKILNLGSSHGYYGINPALFDEISFNGGHVSQSLDCDYLILNKFMDKMDSLKVVILPISYPSMILQLKEGGESFRIANYIIEYGLNSDNWKDRYRLSSLSFKNNIKTIKRYIVNGENNIVCDEYGWHWHSDKKCEKLDNRLENGAIRAEYHHSKEPNSAMFIDNANYVNKIIKLCSDRGVFVVMLTTPAWHTYRDNLHEEQLSKMTLFCDSTAKAHNNVAYINMLADDRFTSDDFYDADHLGKEGAMKLTKILNDTIKICRR